MLRMGMIPCTESENTDPNTRASGPGHLVGAAYANTRTAACTAAISATRCRHTSATSGNTHALYHGSVYDAPRRKTSIVAAAMAAALESAPTSDDAVGCARRHDRDESDGTTAPVTTTITIAATTTMATVEIIDETSWPRKPNGRRNTFDTSCQIEDRLR